MVITILILVMLVLVLLELIECYLQGVVELSLQCHLYALGVIEETEALYLHNTRLLDLVSCFRSVICGFKFKQ